MHTDEAVNAYITGQLLAGETYHYDNHDRHGPALYAAALPIARLAGAKNLAALDETTLRLVPVLAGVLVVLLFVFAVPEIGLATAALAALLWALAALPVYYDRYFIHETIFVAATAGFLLAGWRLLNTASLASAALTGLCAALMLACKETAVLNFAAAGAAIAWWWWETRHTRKSIFGFNSAHWRSGAAALGVFLAVLALLFSWGGQNWQGLADLARSVPRLLVRASGEGHEKTATYYLTLLGNGWSGRMFLLLTLAGGVSVACDAWRVMTRHPSPVTRHSAALRLCLVYALAICVIYSAIPYKTPWLALNLWLPFSVLAAAGAVAVWCAAKSTTARWVLLAFAALMLVALGRTTRKWVFLLPSDEQNPYAYAHTGEDMLRLQEFFDKPARRDALIAVLATDSWPLPWYLRHCSRVGFWQPEQDPGAADFYITLPEAAERMQARLKDWRPEFYGVRPGVLLVLWTPPEKLP